jgi:uncharacterized protein
MTVVGVISDTHGLLRQEALDALAGVDLILHAGDVGKRDVIDRLSTLAPVHAVLGNVDEGDWLPQTVTVQIENTSVVLLHQIEDLQGASGFDAVIYGHSHKAVIEQRDGVLFLNPGSAGPRRFQLPVTIAKMRVDGKSVSADLIELLKD